MSKEYDTWIAQIIQENQPDPNPPTWDIDPLQTSNMKMLSDNQQFQNKARETKMKTVGVFVGEYGASKRFYASQYARHMNIPLLHNIYEVFNYSHSVIVQTLYSNQERINLVNWLESYNIRCTFYWSKTSWLDLLRYSSFVQIWDWYVNHNKWEIPNHSYRTVWWKKHGFIYDNEGK